MIERVRPATPDDVPVLVRLANAARDELALERGGPLWAARDARREPVEETFAADLADPDVAVVAATLDDVVVGYGVARLERLNDGSALGVVADVVVEPGARGIGLGALLLTELVGWCTTRGCIGVDALALPGARETKNFFEENGFSARALILHHRLPRRGDA